MPLNASTHRHTHPPFLNSCTSGHTSPIYTWTSLKIRTHYVHSQISVVIGGHTLAHTHIKLLNTIWVHHTCHYVNVWYGQHHTPVLLHHPIPHVESNRLRPQPRACRWQVWPVLLPNIFPPQSPLHIASTFLWVSWFTHDVVVRSLEIGFKWDCFVPLQRSLDPISKIRGIWGLDWPYPVETLVVCVLCTQ